MALFKKDKKPQEQNPVPETAEDRQKAFKVMELQDMIGKPVIVPSNEIENVTVGIGREIIYLTAAQQPFLVLDDVVRNREILAMGIVFAYTHQKFSGLNKMDPNERIALFYNRLEDYEVDKSATQSEELEDPATWATKVQQSLTNLKPKMKVK